MSVNKKYLHYSSGCDNIPVSVMIHYQGMKRNTENITGALCIWKTTFPISHFAQKLKSKLYSTKCYFLKSDC